MARTVSVDRDSGISAERGGREAQGTRLPSELRERIPAAGLREYWYPAIAARRVPRRRPVALKLLGQDVVLFRGQEGQVAAVQRVCPHRGADLAAGACHFPGTLSCSYHGWTFGTTGECLAALGEGPASRIPGMQAARVRVYPTRTLKGIVFIWMGDAAPAPIEEDVPEEFFDSDSTVYHSITTWRCNWRMAIENFLDAHVFYVHRNSVQFWLLPADMLVSMAHLGPKRNRPKVINGRALVYRLEETPVQALLGGHKLAQPYQDIYPTLGGGAWPRPRMRIYWHRLMALVRRRTLPPPLVRSDEWNGFHLPSTIRVDFRTQIFSRVTIPVDADASRILYFHTVRPRTRLGRAYEWARFHVWQNWQMNHNFSGQDRSIVVRQRYDAPEKLSGTDIFPLETRRLILNHARGLDRSAWANPPVTMEEDAAQ